jgi:hypothetical protein
VRSTGSGTPLVLELRPSGRLAGACTLAWGGGAVAALLSGVPLPLATVLALGALAGLARCLRRTALNTARDAVTALAWGADGGWTLGLGDGSRVTATLLPAPYRQPWLTVLRFRVPGRRLPVSAVITRDRVDPEPFRRLRVRLYLWSQGYEGASSDPR